MVKRLACFLLLFVQAGWVFAQAPVTVTATVLEVDSTNYPQLTAYLRVYDRDRLTPLNDLTITDVFADTDTGELLQVVNLELSTRPVQVVAIADLTGSVSASELDNQKTAIQRLATLLRPNDELALLGMDHQSVETVHPLTADKNDILKGLDSLTPRENVTGNVYWDGIQAGIDLLKNADPNAQKVIILLTDISLGSGAGSATEEEVITAAIDSHVHVFGLHFDYEGDGVPDNPPALPSEVTTLTEATGGLAWGVAAQLRGDDYTDDEALSNMMQNITPLILSEYALELESPFEATGETQGMNITVNYGNLTLPPLRTSFVTGEPIIRINFQNLTDQQGITLPFTAEIAATSTKGTISRLTAYAISEAGRREEIAELDPNAPTLTIPKGTIQAGLFRLLIEAEDSAGNLQEADVFLNVMESLSVTLGELPNEINLDEKITVEAEIGLAASVNSVVLLANEEVVATQDLGPFDRVQLEWQPTKDGEYSLEIRATDILGNSASQSATLMVIGEEDKNNQDIMLLAGVAVLAGLTVTGGTILLLRRRTRPLPTELLEPDVPTEEDPIITPHDTAVSTQAIAELQSRTGERWVLTEGAFLLGRHSSNQIQILDESVSRQHGMIEAKGSHCFYQDTHASHPTEINGQLLDAGQTHELKSGDQLRIGSTILKFTYL